MAPLSLTIFFIFLVLIVISGGSVHLFTDTAFPTIFAYVIVPSLLLAFVSSAQSNKEQNYKYLISVIFTPNKDAALATRFFVNLGDLALLQGSIVFVINLMSLLSNTTPESFNTYFGTGLAHALMSVLVGLIVKIICKSLALKHSLFE